MRRSIVLVLLLAVAGCGKSTDPKDLFDPASEDHKVIETTIRKGLDKPEGELTKEDLLKVESLILPGPKRISDIGPMRGLVNLKKASLQHNNITDLRPLYGLKNMKYIFLNDNPDLTLDDIDKLKKALPHCTINHSIKK